MRGRCRSRCKGWATGRGRSSGRNGHSLKVRVMTRTRASYRDTIGSRARVRVGFTLLVWVQDKDELGLGYTTEDPLGNR